MKRDPRQRTRAVAGLRAITGQDGMWRPLGRMLSSGKQARDAVMLEMGRLVAELRAENEFAVESLRETVEELVPLPRRKELPLLRQTLLSTKSEREHVLAGPAQCAQPQTNLRAREAAAVVEDDGEDRFKAGEGRCRDDVGESPHCGDTCGTATGSDEESRVREPGEPFRKLQRTY